MSTVIWIWIVGMVAGVLAIGWNVFMIVRNEWVYHKRITLLENDRQGFRGYWDYSKMMRHWWIWDVRKMRD